MLSPNWDAPVNELPSNKGRTQVIQFRELYQKICPMIFTTRELSEGVDLGIPKRLEMQPLTEPQMQQFVMAYLPTQGERLLWQLTGRLREFGQTPLLLWMLCLVFNPSQTIPSSLGMVFRKFIEKVYVGKIKDGITTYRNSQIWWGRLLQCLAFEMISGENLTDSRVAISRQRAERILVEFLKGKVEYPDDCAIRWLNDLLKHHLIQINNDLIEFEHQLIQEYYASEWLLGLLENQQISYERLQHDYLNYLKWTEPLALMLELVVSEEQAVRVVRLALEVDLRLGARLAGAVKYGFQEKTVGLLIKEIEERKVAMESEIEFFDETKSSVLLKPLIHALKDANDYVRRIAAKALGKIGIDKAVEPLISALKDSDYSVRKNGAEALVEICSKKAVDALIHAFKDSDYSVRQDAAYALGKIGSEKAVDALIYALKDSDYSVRQNAVEALVEIRSKKAIETLIHVLKDSDDFVRQNVAYALGKIGSERAVEPLILALKDSSDKVRSSAAYALGKIGSEKAVEPLILARKDSVDFVRRSATHAWLKIVSDKEVEFLKNAAEALAKFGSEKAVEALILHVLKNSNWFARTKAAEILARIGSEKAVEVLIHALKDSNDYERRENAAAALGKIGSEKAVEALVYALKDSVPSVLTEVAEALGKIGSEKAVEALIYALKNPQSDDVRNIAQITLGRIGNKKAFESLILALKDPSDIVRRSAASSLGKIGSKKAFEPLILALKDPSDKVRRNAASSLGKIGSKKAVEPLIIALKDSSDHVRGSAASALGNIGSKKAFESLILALKDPSDHVRGSAASALGKLAEDNRNLPILTQQLPYLLTLIPTEASQQALSVILSNHRHPISMQILQLRYSQNTFAGRKQQ